MFVFCVDCSFPFSQILSWLVFLRWWMTAIKLFLVFYHRTTWVAGSLMEISDCQDLYSFHRRGWLLLLFASSLRCVSGCGAQAAIFQNRLHFESRNKSRLRMLECHLSISWSLLIRHSTTAKTFPSHYAICVAKSTHF